MKTVIFACVQNAGRSQMAAAFFNKLASEAQVLITMGCGDECPHVPGRRRDDWPLDDPKGQSLGRAPAIRDDIRARVAALVVREGAR